MEVPYFTSAIHLNNMAISLAERNQYSEAFNTFKSALQVLRGNILVSEVEHKLYRARLYLRTEEDSELSFEQGQQRKEDFSVRIRNFQGHYLLFGPADYAEDKKSAFTCTLIYLQESDLPKYANSIQVYSILLSSILKNQAQVCRKLARDERDGIIAATLYKKSNQLGTLAEAITTKQSSRLRFGKLSSSGVWSLSLNSLIDMPRRNSPPRFPLRKVESAINLRTMDTK